MILRSLGILIRFLRVRLIGYQPVNKFSDDELMCKCGCGLQGVNKGTLERLNLARYLAAVPFKITSSIRCRVHNLSVSTVGLNSPHVRGFAVDISTLHSLPRFIILVSLLLAGFTRIGIGSNFIHADDDPSKVKEVIWTY